MKINPLPMCVHAHIHLCSYMHAQHSQDNLAVPILSRTGAVNDMPDTTPRLVLQPCLLPSTLLTPLLLIWLTTGAGAISTQRWEGEW